MITRRATSCLKALRLPSQCGRSIRYARPQRRRLSSSASAPTVAPLMGQSPAAPLSSITSELDKLAPRFDVSADDIQILQSPSEFFETLKAKILKAERRIYLSTLYVGKTEHELVWQPILYHGRHD